MKRSELLKNEDIREKRRFRTGKSRDAMNKGPGNREAGPVGKGTFRYIICGANAGSGDVPARYFSHPLFLGWDDLPRRV